MRACHPVIPSAVPSSAAKTGDFGGRLFERSEFPSTARLGEQRREVRSTVAAGSPSLWFLSLGKTRERNLPPGNPRPAQVTSAVTYALRWTETPLFPQRVVSAPDLFQQAHTRSMRAHQVAANRYPTALFSALTPPFYPPTPLAACPRFQYPCSLTRFTAPP